MNAATEITVTTTDLATGTVTTTPTVAALPPAKKSGKPAFEVIGCLDPGVSRHDGFYYRDKPRDNGGAGFIFVGPFATEAGALAMQFLMTAETELGDAGSKVEHFSGEEIDADKANMGDDANTFRQASDARLKAKEVVAAWDAIGGQQPDADTAAYLLTVAEQIVAERAAMVGGDVDDVTGTVTD